MANKSYEVVSQEGIGAQLKKKKENPTLISGGATPQGTAVTGSPKRGALKRFIRMLAQGKKYKPYESDLPAGATARGYGVY